MYVSVCVCVCVRYFNKHFHFVCSFTLICSKMVKSTGKSFKYYAMPYSQNANYPLWLHFNLLTFKCACVCIEKMMIVKKVVYFINFCWKILIMIKRKIFHAFKVDALLTLIDSRPFFQYILIPSTHFHIFLSLSLSLSRVLSLLINIYTVYVYVFTSPLICLFTRVHTIHRASHWSAAFFPQKIKSNELWEKSINK